MPPAATPRPRSAPSTPAEQNLQRRLADTDVVPPDVRKGVTEPARRRPGAAGQGRGSNGIGLRRPDHHLRADPADRRGRHHRIGPRRRRTIRAETLGPCPCRRCPRADDDAAALVNLGGELPEPGAAHVDDHAGRHRAVDVVRDGPGTRRRLAGGQGAAARDGPSAWRIISDPNVPLVGNPRAAPVAATTNQIAAKIIDDTMPVDHRRRRANRRRPARTEAIRDSAIVGAARSCWRCCSSPSWPGRWCGRCARCATARCRVAHDDLARETRAGALRRGRRARSSRIPVHTTEEVGQVAHAVDELHEQAVFLAGEQSRLQLQVGDMFETLSRRSRSPGRPAADAHRPARAQRGGSRNGWRACSGSTTWPRGCAATAPTCWCSPAPRCRASRPTPVPVAALINAAASEVEDYARVVTATVPDSEIVGIDRGRPRPPACRAARQRAALLAADLAGAGVGRAHRQRRAGHRGQRHRPRHDRIRSAGGQHPPAVRWRGQPVHRPPHGSVRGRPAGRAARARGPPAQHRCGRTEFGYHRRRVRAVGADRARRYARPDRHRPTGRACRRRT